MSLSKLTPTDMQTVNARLKKAQASRLPLSDSHLSDRLIKLITAHADAIGVPHEFILWPLLTAAASFMGTNAFVRINAEWLEPSIIWFIIAARKGEKKTAALKRIRKPIEELQKKLHTNWEEASDELKPAQPPQLIVDHFSFEELHAIMCRNRSQVLGCFDEMSTFYGQLDLYKHSSTVDRKTLLTLNGGGPWARNFKSYSGNMEKTAFNITGFIQPAFVYEMLNLTPDADGLNDRQLVDFPLEREMLLDELVVPMPSDTPDLLEIFEMIAENHDDTLIYTLENESYTAFRDIHDRLVEEKLKSTNENAQGILSKARGYVARIALVIHCLELSLSTSSPRWDTNISVDAVKAATAIIQHFNQQKFIMLGLNENSSDSSLSNRMIRLLTMTSKNGSGKITPSEVSQKHISERVGGSYPTSKAIEALEEAVKLGYGTIEDCITPNNRTVKHFRKRHFSELTNECKEQLKKAKVNEENYSRAFSSPGLEE